MAEASLVANNPNPDGMLDVTIMRAGTSKGIFLHLDDVPSEREQRLAFLEQLLGTDSAQMDGIGGGQVLTSKVALVSASAEEGIDVDYKFVQVVPGRSVDDTISCGNLMTAVAPFAVETGLVPAQHPETLVIVRDINNGARATIVLQTPGGKLTYAGDVELAGIPSKAAPISVCYNELITDPATMLPTGNVIDEVNGLQVTYIDTAIPLLIFRGEALDLEMKTLRQLHNRDTIEELLNARDKLLENIGANVNRKSVSPKIALVGTPTENGTLAVRYFTPHTPHRSLAVTGAIALAAACAIPGTVAAAAAVGVDVKSSPQQTIRLQHMSGTFEVEVEFAGSGKLTYPASAKVLRTARLLIRGTAYVPNFYPSVTGASRGS